MSNNFNELLLQTLKDVGIRLERLEGRVDHVINEKADETDVKEVKADLKSAIEKLDQKADKTDVQDVRSELKAVIEKLDQKADKTDVQDVRSELKAVIEKLDQKADKADVNALRDEVRSQGQRLDRIEMGIKTLQWTMTAGIAVLGIILAFVRSC
ncbi:hypothetical protein F4054_01360 [Candidatus Poribacteria bacterium]|nr:hypothetical protein [Candidatus Poribacteria bacterium]MYK20888.1 hypothetical protein [Candidatus Poribacteria bacterium]